MFAPPPIISHRLREKPITRSHTFLIRHSVIRFEFRYCLSIGVIHAIRDCLLSPKRKFSPEEQLVLHAYSHNPLRGL
jgi:hypothetical protein